MTDVMTLGNYSLAFETPPRVRACSMPGDSKASFARRLQGRGRRTASRLGRASSTRWPDPGRRSACGSCSIREPCVPALGALTAWGNQAVQMVRAGLKAIYLSGWQVAADANLGGHTYPDQSLYPVEQRVPAVWSSAGSTQALHARRPDRAPGRGQEPATTLPFAPIIADAEAGFGGPLNAFELMKAMIEAGAAAVHFEDQLASEKKCGRPWAARCSCPPAQFIRTLVAARLSRGACSDVPTLLVARTDARDSAASC